MLHKTCLDMEEWRHLWMSLDWKRISTGMRKMCAKSVSAGYVVVVVVVVVRIHRRNRLGWQFVSFCSNVLLFLRLEFNLSATAVSPTFVCQTRAAFVQMIIIKDFIAHRVCSNWNKYANVTTFIIKWNFSAPVDC